MTTFRELEQQQNAWLKAQEKRDTECITCPKCSGQWFEAKRFARYKIDHYLIPGQDVPIRPGTVQYVMLECGVCKNMLEPRVMHNSRDVLGDDYGHFLDTLEGKHDERKKEQEVPDNNEIQAQEL